jgi:hypothetical protein
VNVFTPAAASDRSFAQAGTSAVVEHAQEGLHPNEGAKPDAAADEKKSDWKSTASATAKLLLRGVRDSADAFGPLKAVAGGLCFILENCEVWLSSHPLSATLTGVPANEREPKNDRVVGTQGQGPLRLALRICF